MKAAVNSATSSSGRGGDLHKLSNAVAPVSSAEALAALILLNTIAMQESTTDALSDWALDSMPACKALGDGPEGWRVDIMLRALYNGLSPAHRAIVDGDQVGFVTPLWQMMTGEMVSL